MSVFRNSTPLRIAAFNVARKLPTLGPSGLRRRYATLLLDPDAELSWAVAKCDWVERIPGRERKVWARTGERFLVLRWENKELGSHITLFDEDGHPRVGFRANDPRMGLFFDETYSLARSA